MNRTGPPPERRTAGPLARVDRSGGSARARRPLTTKHPFVPTFNAQPEPTSGFESIGSLTARFLDDLAARIALADLEEPRE
jgi:hypothetical protein